MEYKHFINLTNGIEALSEYNIPNPYYIRIQSTACEQKRWGFILDDLDCNFLMSLALGCRCFLYDYGANKAISRAMWQGVSWIKYALMRNWFGIEIDSFSKSGVNMKGYFSKAYYGLHKTTKKKLAYFKKFLNTDEINIQIVSGATKHDGDYKYYNQSLVRMQKATPHNSDVINQELIKMEMISKEDVKGKTIITTKTKVFFFWKKIRQFEAQKEFLTGYWEWVELPNRILVHGKLSFQLDVWNKL